MAVRPAVRGGTALPLVEHGRATTPAASSRFSAAFLFQFWGIFRGALLNLFESVFRLELGLGIRIVRLD